MVEWQIAEGASALVGCGTTGEAATLNAEERERLVRACVLQAKGRVPVVAGAGSNDTRTALRNLREVRVAGADAALVVSPYYNCPSQEGLFEHFAALASAAELPTLVYNVPKRTGTDLHPDTLARPVGRFPEAFLGIKDSSGIFTRVAQTRARLGKDFLQLTGNDETALAFLAMGGMGCISVTANVAPRLALHSKRRIETTITPRLWTSMIASTPCMKHSSPDASPGPVKYALTRVRMGFPGTLRLPMM